MDNSNIDTTGRLESQFFGDSVSEAPALPPTIMMRPPQQLATPQPPAPPPALPPMHHTWLDRVRLHLGAWWASVRARMHHHAAATMPPAAPAAPGPAIGYEATFGAQPDSEAPALLVAGEGLGSTYDTSLRG